MLEVYGRLHGAVNNHEKPQRSALEERVRTRNPATPADPVPDSPFGSFRSDRLRVRTKDGLNIELITNAIKIVSVEGFGKGRLL
jgi:hypothetical protein